jgi:type III pantothenate kinase
MWAIDIGNTQTVAGYIQDGKVIYRSRISSKRFFEIAELNKWINKLKKIKNTNIVGISNVVPKLEPIFKKTIKHNFDLNPIFVEPIWPNAFKMKILILKPQTLGADRWANSIAAKILYGFPCIIVDFGTATTFDVIDRKGDYYGGVILPGINISLSALHTYTAKLPLVSFKKMDYTIAKDTVSAIRSGIFWGMIGQLREILLRVRKEIGVVAPAIATGGWSYLFHEMNIFHKINQDLTLQGIEIFTQTICAKLKK